MDGSGLSKANGRNNAGEPSPNQPPSAPSVAWPEIFSQHESNLTRHIEICSKVQSHVPPGDESFRAISAIIQGTEKLVGDLDKLRTEFMPHSAATNILSGKTLDRVNRQRAAARATPTCEKEENNKTSPPNNTSAATKDGARAPQSPSFIFDKKPSPVSLPQRLKTGRKRSWGGDDDPVSDNNPPTNETPGGKRAKLPLAHQNASDTIHDDNVRDNAGASSTPVVEVEDISDEVEARLKLREENRRKRKEKPQGKRKRRSSTYHGETQNGDLQERKKLKPASAAGGKSQSRRRSQEWSKNRKRSGAGTVEQGDEEPDTGKRAKRAKNV